MSGDAQNATYSTDQNAQSFKQIIWSLLPDFNTTAGFLFYTVLVYSFLLMTSWFAQPVLDEACEQEIRENINKEKNKKMREKNKM